LRGGARGGGAERVLHMNRVKRIKRSGLGHQLVSTT
jgi:hypothetical protein